jgi:hypothetical protein
MLKFSKELSRDDYVGKNAINSDTAMPKVVDYLKRKIN